MAQRILLRHKPGLRAGGVLKAGIVGPGRRAIGLAHGIDSRKDFIIGQRFGRARGGLGQHRDGGGAGGKQGSGARSKQAAASDGRHCSIPVARWLCQDDAEVVESVEYAQGALRRK
nr:hypothetical protein [Devosia ginsengisoli]